MLGGLPSWSSNMLFSLIKLLIICSRSLVFMIIFFNSKSTNMAVGILFILSFIIVCGRLGFLVSYVMVFLWWGLSLLVFQLNGIFDLLPSLLLKLSISFCSFFAKKVMVTTFLYHLCLSFYLSNQPSINNLWSQVRHIVEWHNDNLNNGSISNLCTNIASTEKQKLKKHAGINKINKCVFKIDLLT